MKATELRIGNYVYSTDSLGNNEVYLLDTGIHIHSVYRSRRDFFESFKPIPLAEEWLVKFGFEIEKTSETSVIFPIECNVSEIHYGQKHPNVLIKEISRDRNTRFFIKLDIVNNELESVHQLQNLYFALTGEELQCN